MTIQDIDNLTSTPDGDQSWGADLRGAMASLLGVTRRGHSIPSGGGVLTWTGSVLSGTQGYVWLPAGGGGGKRFVLEGTANNTDGWTISSITGWSIVYYRATSEEWAGTGRVSILPAQMTVADPVATYVPDEKDLVLGVRNALDERFYLTDGRTLDYWRSPTLSNAWVNYTGYVPAGYMKDSDGFVHLRGLVQSGTVGAVMFTMPAGYWPYQVTQAGTTSQHFAVATNTGHGYLAVGKGGTVALGTGGNGWVDLAGAAPFRAEV